MLVGPARGGFGSNRSDLHRVLTLGVAFEVDDFDPTQHTGWKRSLTGHIGARFRASTACTGLFRRVH
jgi:hypothetical protein